MTRTASWSSRTATSRCFPACRTGSARSADPARLDALGGAVEAALRKLPGTRSAVFEGLGGERRLSFELDAQALARWDVDPERARAVADFVATGGAIGEIPATETSAKRPL